MIKNFLVPNIPSASLRSAPPLAQGRHTRANFQCAMLTWFTANSLFRHRALPLRIRVNQSLSRFSLSEWCDVEFHSDSTWSFSLPSWAVILLHKTAKLHVNNAGRCSKAPKETPILRGHWIAAWFNMKFRSVLRTYRNIHILFLQRRAKLLIVTTLVSVPVKDSLL